MNLIYAFIIILIIAISLLLLNFFLATYSPDVVKISPFECGYTSFQQSREPFNVSFFIIGLLFLLFDIEISFLYPLLITDWNWNSISVISIFLILLTSGLVFEIQWGMTRHNLKGE